MTILLDMPHAQIVERDGQYVKRSKPCGHERASSAAEYKMLRDVDVFVETGLMSCATCIKAVTDHRPGDLARMRERNQRIGQALASREPRDGANPYLAAIERSTA